MKKKPNTWKTKSGSEIDLTNMTDAHLANAIKLVARNCHKTGYLGTMTSDKTYKKLLKEAKNRKFNIHILKEPIKSSKGHLEYVEITIPINSKLSSRFLITDYDSRPQE